MTRGILPWLPEGFGQGRGGGTISEGTKFCATMYPVPISLPVIGACVL